VLKVLKILKQTTSVFLVLIFEGQKAYGSSFFGPEESRAFRQVENAASLAASQTGEQRKMSGGTIILSRETAFVSPQAAMPQR